MHDAKTVAVRHRAQQLAQHALRLRLGEAALLHDGVEELAAAQQFHHQVGARRRTHHFVQPHNVRVVGGLEHGHLHPQRLQRLNVLVLLNHLHRELGTRDVLAVKDLREPPRTQGAPKRVPFLRDVR